MVRVKNHKKSIYQIWIGPGPGPGPEKFNYPGPGPGPEKFNYPGPGPRKVD